MTSNRFGRTIPGTGSSGLATPVTTAENLASVEDRTAALQRDRRVATTIKTQQRRFEAFEEELVRELKQPSCPSVGGQIDLEALHARLQEQYWDPDYIQIALCASSQDQQAYYRQNSSYKLSWEQHVRSQLRRMRQIGAKSVMGIAMSAEYKGVPDMFIVKTTADISRGAEALRHEFLVGQYGTNALRTERIRDGVTLPPIPNFSVVFFGFGCSGTFIAQPDADLTDVKHRKGEALGYCTGRGSIQYAGYENIRDARDAGDAVAQMTRKELRQTYFQYLCAGETGYEECGFVHNDLHPGNARLRNLPHPALIRYTLDGGKREYYVKAPWVVTLIDYGEAYIEVKGQPMGVSSDVGFVYGRSTRTSRPLGDAYKFLLGLAEAAVIDGRGDLLDDLEVALRYWNPEANIETVVETERETYFSMADRPDLDNVSLLGLIDYLLAHWDMDGIVYSSPPAGAPRLECHVEGGMCAPGGLESKEAAISVPSIAPTTLATAADEYSTREGASKAAYLATVPLEALIGQDYDRIAAEYAWLQQHYDHVSVLLRPSIRADNPEQRVNELLAAATYIFEAIDLEADIATFRRAIAILTSDGSYDVKTPDLDAQEANTHRIMAAFNTRLLAEVQTARAIIPADATGTDLRQQLRNLETQLKQTGITTEMGRPQVRHYLKGDAKRAASA